MIPHIPLKVGVLQSITFSNIQDEARLVLLAKLCVPSKKFFCYGDIILNNISYTEQGNLHRCMFSFLTVSNKYDKWLYMQSTICRY